MATAAQTQPITTDEVVRCGRNAALRGMPRLITNPADAAEEAAFLSGFDSVPEYLRGTEARNGPPQSLPEATESRPPNNGRSLPEIGHAVAAKSGTASAACRPVDRTQKPKRSIQWTDELFTTRQLMEFLSLSRTKIWELVNKEQLPGFKIGGDYRYRRSEVIEWLERYRVKRG